MNATIPLSLLELFVAVAESSSLSAASKKLAMSKATVSRGLSRLEDLVGAELLHRTTRQVSLTTAGAALFERAAPHVDALRQALDTMPEQLDEPAGELRITAPTDFGVQVLPEIITRFSLRYPRVRFDVHVTNRRVDLVAEGFDLAIRGVGPTMDDSSLIMRVLTPIEPGFFASPSYLARHGVPRTVEDPGHVWAFLRMDMTAFGIPESVKPQFLCGDFFFIRELLRAGAAIGRLPTYLAAPYVLSGELTRVLPDAGPRTGGRLVLLHAPHRNLPRKVTAFRDFLIETLQARPLAVPT
jgi:DNA-binding transcriptional LysR family regulator